MSPASTSRPLMWPVMNRRSLMPARPGPTADLIPRATRDEPSRPSAVEDRPADLVSQPLIVQDEFANHIRELIALPTALEPAGALTLPSRGRRPHGLDRVRRSTKLVCGDMRHHCRLAGSICGMPSGSAQLSCRSHCMAARRPGLRHPDFAACPCPNLLDRLAGPRVRGLHRLEVVQNVLRARGSPESQEPMVGVGKRPATADGDEAGVAIFREDHFVFLPLTLGMAGDPRSPTYSGSSVP